MSGVLQLEVVLQRGLRAVYFLTDLALGKVATTCWSRTRSLNLRLCFFLREEAVPRAGLALLEASRWESSSRRCSSALTRWASLSSSPSCSPSGHHPRSW